MIFVKYVLLFIVLLLCNLLGKALAKKYTDRLKELEEMKIALNILKSKIKFTYSPLPEIFGEISESIGGNIGKIFNESKKLMLNTTAKKAWEEALKTSKNNLKQEDKNVLKNLSKMLGQTDIEGQVSQIEVTENFLERLIIDANNEKVKNEKLYIKLGTTIGLAVAIILI